MKKIGKATTFIVSTITLLFVNSVHTIAADVRPEPMIVYASPEFFACHGNVLCTFLYRNIKLVFIVAIFIVLLVIFLIAKFILNLIRKHK